MGNKNLSTKNRILEILRTSTEPVSGDLIAEKLEVSRVSVWKAVQALVESGYGITSSRHGYTLEKDLKDCLYPWEFGEKEESLSHFTEIESTMNQARMLAQKDSNFDYHVVTADRQTNGKGRAGHVWTTTDGSLAFTLIYKKPVPLAKSGRVLMTAQVALVKTLKSLSGKNFFVRWPNDIWSEKGKVAGILDEISASAGTTRWINLGIGVNLNSAPNLLKTDCVFDETSDISRKEVLSLFLEEFRKAEELLNSNDETLLCKEWMSLSFDGKKSINVHGKEGSYIFKDISPLGECILENGTDLQSFFPGTISIEK